MKKRYVLLNYTRFGYDKFISKAKEIQTGLSNGIFNTVQPTPAEVTPLITELDNLWSQIKLGNKLLIPQRDALKVNIISMLDRQGAAVNYMAAGDMSILVQSGFDISKVRENRPTPTQGATPKVKQEGGGTVILSTKGIDFEDFIEAEVDGPDGFCKTYSGKHSKMKIPNLPIGVSLKGRMRGVNGHGPGEWTDSVSFIAYGSAQHDNNTTV